MSILTLQAKNAAKVARVTLSRVNFMAGPHTQPRATVESKGGYRVSVRALGLSRRE